MDKNDISFELLREIERVLIIIFIIATVLANLTFLLKCRRISEVLNKSVYCSRIFLSLGCIILALFSYVVMARGYFLDADEDVKKFAKVTSKLYFFNFFPFVFGCGLLLQGLSLMSNLNTPFKRASCMLGPKIKSLMMAILPWGLGLVLVCLLVFIDSESKDEEGDCFGSELSRSTFVAITIICTITPAVVALICSVVLITRARQDPLERVGNRPVTSHDPLVPSAPGIQQDTRQPRLVPAIQSPYPLHTYQEKYPQQAPLESPPGYPHSYPQQSPPIPQNPPVPHSPQMMPTSPPPFSQNAPPDSPPEYSQLYPQQYPQPQSQVYPHGVHSQQYLQLYSQQYPQQYDVPSSPQPQGPPIYATPIPTTPTPEETGATWRSKVIHLIACIVFAVSVLPASLLRLGMNCGALREVEEEELVIFHVSFMWLLFVYPVVVPSLWGREIKTRDRQV